MSGYVLSISSQAQKCHTRNSDRAQDCVNLKNAERYGIYLWLFRTLGLHLASMLPGTYGKLGKNEKTGASSNEHGTVDTES